MTLACNAASDVLRCCPSEIEKTNRELSKEKLSLRTKKKPGLSFFLSFFISFFSSFSSSSSSSSSSYYYYSYSSSLRQPRQLHYHRGCLSFSSSSLPPLDFLSLFAFHFSPLFA